MVECPGVDLLDINLVESVRFGLQVNIHFNSITRTPHYYTQLKLFYFNEKMIIFIGNYKISANNIIV